MEIFFSLLFIGVFSPQKLFVGKSGDQVRLGATVSEGKFVVVAEDPNCGKPEKHICLFSGGAEELADDSFVSTAFPSVAADSAGNIYVVWADAREIEPTSDQRTWDIYLRKKQSGGGWSPSERINPKTASDACGQEGDQINPDIYVSNTGLYIVWQTIEKDGRSFVCYVRSPNFGGSWEPNKKLFEGYNPAIAVSGDKVFIAYADIDGNIHLAVSEDGGNTFTVRTSPVVDVQRRIPDLSAPDLAVSPSGNLILVWQDKPIKPGKPDDIDIFISVSRDGGQTWGTPQQLDLEGDQINPAVVFLGGTFIFFSSESDPLQGFDIYYVESRGHLTLSAGDNNPTGTLSVLSGERSVVVAQLRFDGSSELSEAEVRTISVKALGTMNDVEHISQIQVWWDKDGNGTLSSPDILLGSGKFSSDNGVASLPGGVKVVTPNPEYVIITADFVRPIPRDSTFSVEVETQGVLAVLPGTEKAVDVIGSTVSGRVIRISNNLPTARVTSSHSSVLEGSGTRVRLDASQSSDPDSDLLSFSWRQVAGPTVSLSTSGAIAEFTAPDNITGDQNLVFEVEVSDGFGGASTAQVVVRAVDSINEPPNAVARVNISGNRFQGPVFVDEGDIVILDATESSDPNGDALFYFWTQKSGKQVEIINPSQATAYFIAPDVIGVSSEILVFHLAVRDENGAFDSDEIEVRVKNTKNDPPVAKFIANPVKGTAPLDVVFDASPSYDPDGSITLYRWSFGDGTELSTSNPSISHRFTSPGEYRVVLTVYDTAGDSATYSQFITALTSSPEVFIYPVLATSDVPYGTLEDILYIRVSNISAENILVDNMKFTVEGVPDAVFTLMLDRNGDRRGDITLHTFSLSTTRETFIVPIDLVVGGGENLNFVLRVKASPIRNLPVDYSISLDGVSARGTVSGVEAGVSGVSLPERFMFSVRNPALFFSSEGITQVVVSGLSASFSIAVEGRGDSFSINNLALEYDPVIIYNVVIFSDENGNGRFDVGENILANLKNGEQSASLSFSVAEGQKKYLGFYIYVGGVKRTPPTMTLSGYNFNPPVFESIQAEAVLVISVLFALTFLLAVSRLEMKRRKRLGYLWFITAFILTSSFAIYFSFASCANRAGGKGKDVAAEKGELGEQVGESGGGGGGADAGAGGGDGDQVAGGDSTGGDVQNGVDGQNGDVGQNGGVQNGGNTLVGQNSTSFVIKGVSATSARGADSSVVGLPIKITVLY